MADFYARPAGAGPNGLPPRQTLETSAGHQIRIRQRSYGQKLCVTCVCLVERSGRVAASIELTDGAPDQWAHYNGLPHRETAGPFVPRDVITGRPQVSWQACLTEPAQAQEP